MGKIYTSVDQLIGGTPLLELTHLERELGLSARGRRRDKGGLLW